MNLLKPRIPRRVVNAVLAITKLKNENYLNYILRVKADKLADDVKVLDIEHNLLSSSNNNSTLGIVRRQRYEMAKYILEWKHTDE